MILRLIVFLILVVISLMTVAGISLFYLFMGLLFSPRLLSFFINPDGFMDWVEHFYDASNVQTDARSTN